MLQGLPTIEVATSATQSSTFAKSAMTGFVAPLLRPAPLQRHKRHTRRPRRCLAAAQRLPPFSPPSEGALSTFSDLVRGEWKGYEGRFTPDGTPIPVADYYIPEEFSEWGLIPHGFECVHSVIVRGNKLYRKFFRILPSVSLFADHVDTEEEFGYVSLDAPGVSVFENGSWMRGPERMKRKESKLEKWPNLEMCVRHPGGERRCVTAVLPLDWENGKVVNEIRVVLEEWTCEYCDGADMEGGSGFVEGWVVEERTPMEGDWRSEEGQVGHCGVPLPQGIDFGLQRGEHTDIWVGWRVGGSRAVLRRRFDQDGNVLFSERVLEKKV